MICLKCLRSISGQMKYGLHEECFVSWFKTDATNEFQSLIPRSATSLDPERKDLSNNQSFYHGKFKKYSANLDKDRYILKMRDTMEAPELPEVEFLCNKIAESMGVPIADFFYIDFYGEKIFVTKVFIHKNQGHANLEHIYKFRDGKDHNCETLIKVISEITKLPHDVEIFIQTLLFDALIGNHDRHGRNLAFISSPTKTILSPIYDNVSYLSLVYGPILKADFNPTGRIATKKTNEPSMSDYIQELKRLGYDEAINNFFKKINLNKIESLIEDSFCTNPMKQALKKLIHKRYKEYLNAI